MITCKEPGCGAEVDTSLACLDVTSLFGLRQMLEHLADGDSAVSLSRERTKELAYVNRQLENFGLTDEHRQPGQTGSKIDMPKAPLNLRLSCPKGHRFFYKITCTPENDSHGNQ